MDKSVTSHFYPRRLRDIGARHFSVDKKSVLQTTPRELEFEISDMSEVKIENRVTFCGECGFTAEYEVVLQHFHESHSGKDTGTTNEVTIIETPSISLEPSNGTPSIAEIADAHENERNIILWTKPSTAKLIEIVKAKQEEFNSPYMRKKDVWKVVSQELSSKHNISASAIQCENKWKAIARKYRKHGDHSIRKFAFSNNLSKILKARSHPSESVRQHDAENADASPPESETHVFCTNDVVSTSPVLDELSMHTYSCRTEPSPSNEQRQAEDLCVEPQWFKTFRIECQKRHEERMELQNKLLDQHHNLMMQLILTMANLKD